MTFIIGKGQSETPTGKDGQDPQIHLKKAPTTTQRLTCSPRHIHDQLCLSLIGNRIFGPYTPFCPEFVADRA